MWPMFYASSFNDICAIFWNLSGLVPDNKFPGDYTDGETPDPIPNSEAKAVRPMVVFIGESR